MFESHTSYHLPVLGHISAESLNKIKNLQKKPFVYIIHFKKILTLYYLCSLSPKQNFTYWTNANNIKTQKLSLCSISIFRQITRIFQWLSFLKPLALGGNHNYQTRTMKLAFTLDNANSIRNTITRHWNAVISHLPHDPKKITPSRITQIIPKYHKISL